MKLTRNLVLAVIGWAVLAVVLVVGLSLAGVGSVVFAGALGAYCGITIVVVNTLRERAAQRAKRASGRPEGRYGR